MSGSGMSIVTDAEQVMRADEIVRIGVWQPGPDDGPRVVFTHRPPIAEDVAEQTRHRVERDFLVWDSQYVV